MSKKIKVLNLSAGIGGNRKLWPDDEIEVTAVEWDEEIAKIYQDFFPNDKVIVADAHQYLLENYMNFDFIWSSPPCPTHSDIRRCGVDKGQYKAQYPDMKLYEEIILLQYFAPKHCKWVVENVTSYYVPLIKPYESHRHYFWSNFYVGEPKIKDNRIHNNLIGSKPLYGFDLKDYDFNDKRLLIRNLVNPELGLYIFRMALKEKQTTIAGLMHQLNKKGKG